MPVYEYTCQKCNHVTEAIRRIAQADQPQTCEACGHSKTTRAFSLFNAGGTTTATDAGPCGLPMSGGAAPGMGGCCGGVCGGGH